MAARAKMLVLLLACCCLPAYSHAFNRIASVAESGAASWSRSFTYDPYGNRAATGLQVTSATPPAATSTYYVAATNRLVSDWALYDNAGNVTAFKNPNGLSTGQWSAGYDGENKQRYYCWGTIAACNAGNADAEYVYDGEGNRVQKLTSSSTTTYVYDAFGRLAAEYTMGGPSEEAGTFYRTTDHLGSTRLVTDAAGEIVSRRDFFPFGEQIAANSSSGRNDIAEYNEQMGFPQLFTGKERDDESGLDYFLARYFSGAQGRFTSPDEPLIDQIPSDPQSWNLFSYVRNNPLKFTDPTGQDCVYTNNDDGTVGLERGDSCSQKGGTYVHGTIDVDSFTYDSKTNSIGYTYSNAADGSGGTGSIGLRDAPTYGEAFMSQMAGRRGASNQFIGEFARQAAVGAAGGKLISAGIEAGLAAMAARAAAAQEAALGLGITGTKAATTVAEKLALEAAASNPAAGKVLQTRLNDPRWPSSQGWVKMESRSPGGVVVHWVRNTITGAAADFKLK